MAEENSLHKQIREMLKKEEGYADMVSSKKRFGTESKYGGYLDSRGYTTTGIGHLVSKADPGSKQFHKDVEKFNKDYKDIIPNLSESYSYHNLNEEDANKLFDRDSDKSIQGARRIIKNRQLDLSDSQTTALTGMVFQMGEEGVSKFHRTFKLLKQGKNKEAGENVLGTTWASQTPNRAKEMSNLLKIGKDEENDLLFEEAEKKIGEEDQTQWNKDAMNQIKEQAEEQGKRDQIMNIFRQRNRNRN